MRSPRNAAGSSGTIWSWGSPCYATISVSLRPLRKGPAAWILGRRAVQAADAADAADETAGSNRGVAVAGMVLGIIGTVMLVVVVIGFVASVAFIVAGTRTP